MALALLAGTPAGAAPARTYTNPVSASFADTFADPAVIQAKDGWWYAYSTADPLRAGDEPGIMHIARTRDWVRWEYRGTVFTAANRPAYATPTAGLWAPDVRYVDGRYVLYYTVTDTTLNPGDDSAIGLATAPTPTGPWTPSDEPVVAPRPGNGGFLWTFDPAMFTDVDGQRYLYYGSYNGGLWARKLADDGLSTVGGETQVAIDNRYEGSYVVRHEGWYYLMGSAANCCAGPTTGYSVFSGRSRSPLGPFLDADGISLLDSAVGGTVLLTQNGNRWIGAGHHALFTDAAGQTFIAYHALDRNEPWLTEPFGINRRPMLIDRVDWIDGFPRTRAGRGPSDRPQAAPVTGSQTGVRTPADRVRVRLDVQTTRPFTVSLGTQRNGVEVTYDPRGGALVVRTVVDGRARTTTDALDVRPGWSTLGIEVDGRSVEAYVSESDLGDPRAEVRVRRTGLDLPAAPVRLTRPGARVANLTVRALARPVRSLAATPRTGRLLDADEFGSGALDGWTWLRENPAADVTGGRLRWPVEGLDLVGGGNDAGVLLRSATPNGSSWIAETRVDLDLGEGTVRNFQQAGMIAYRNDDDFARLSKVAIWNTRQTEFGRELVATADGRTSYGGAVIGTPGPTTYLRLAYRRNAAGEHVFRAGTSRDGRAWTWGAAWTFAPGPVPRIGLVAHGGAAPAVTAEFDYLRFYAVR